MYLIINILNINIITIIVIIINTSAVSLRYGDSAGRFRTLSSGL